MTDPDAVRQQLNAWRAQAYGSVEFDVFGRTMLRTADDVIGWLGQHAAFSPQDLNAA